MKIRERKFNEVQVVVVKIFFETHAQTDANKTSGIFIDPLQISISVRSYVKAKNYILVKLHILQLDICCCTPFPIQAVLK